MNTDALFKELEPPPGGAERFAQRLDELAAERPSPRARRLALAAAGAAAALVTAILLLRAPGDTPPQPVVADAPPAVDVYGAREFDRLLGRASPPAELMVVVNAQPASVTEIATSNEKVRIYQIDEPAPAAPPP
jgi:hypothetical protein